MCSNIQAGSSRERALEEVHYGRPSNFRIYYINQVPNIRYTMAESIYYDSLKVSKSKCQFIWREWRGGNGGALLEASRGLRGLQMHIGDSEVWWQPLLSLWGSLEASKKVRRFRRAISATWFDTLILTLSKSHSRLIWQPLCAARISKFWHPSCINNNLHGLYSIYLYIYILI